MTDPPVPKHYSPMWSGDTRTTPPALGDERETLSSYLDWHRATFELKCSGVPLERLSERTVPPSSLSLHGLARHRRAVLAALAHGPSARRVRPPRRPCGPPARTDRRRHRHVSIAEGC